MKNKIFSYILILSILISIIPISVIASYESELYLVLGDSISTGYGLSDSNDCFANIIKENNGFSVVNRAVNGSKTIDLLNLIKTSTLDNDIKKAKLITITTGGNDLIAMLYEKIAEEYNSAFTDKISAENVISILSDSKDERNTAVLICGMKVLNAEPAFSESEEFSLAISSYTETLCQTIEYIKDINPEAKIIVCTQYNPYETFSGFYTVLRDGLEGGINKLNNAIKENASSGYYVADVYSAFKANGAKLCNADETASNFDFHPNTDGHKIIADCIGDTIEFPFTDVNKDSWYYDAVRYAFENKIFSGVSETSFAPELPMTRAMITTVLYRIEGEPEVNGSCAFRDVKKDAYYEKAVIWASENGIVKGYSENAFGTEDYVTREQLATIILRYAILKGKGPAGMWAIRLDYSDMNEISDYAVEGIMYCTLKNLMQGDDTGKFRPKDNLSRAEAAAVMQRFLLTIK